MKKAIAVLGLVGMLALMAGMPVLAEKLEDEGRWALFGILINCEEGNEELALLPTVIYQNVQALEGVNPFKIRIVKFGLEDELLRHPRGGIGSGKYLIYLFAEALCSSSDDLATSYWSGNYRLCWMSREENTGAEYYEAIEEYMDRFKLELLQVVREGDTLYFAYHYK